MCEPTTASILFFKPSSQGLLSQHPEEIAEAVEAALASVIDPEDIASVTYDPVSNSVVVRTTGQSAPALIDGLVRQRQLTVAGACAMDEKKEKRKKRERKEKKKKKLEFFLLPLSLSLSLSLSVFLFLLGFSLSFFFLLLLLLLLLPSFFLKTSWCYAVQGGQYSAAPTLAEASSDDEDSGLTQTELLVVIVAVSLSVLLLLIAAVVVVRRRRNSPTAPAAPRQTVNFENPMFRSMENPHYDSSIDEHNASLYSEP